MQSKRTMGQKKRRDQLFLEDSEKLERRELKNEQEFTSSLALLAFPGCQFTQQRHFGGLPAGDIWSMQRGMGLTWQHTNHKKQNGSFPVVMPRVLFQRLGSQKLARIKTAYSMYSKMPQGVTSCIIPLTAAGTYDLLVANRAWQGYEMPLPWYYIMWDYFGWLDCGETPAGLEVRWHVVRGPVWGQHGWGLQEMRLAFSSQPAKKAEISVLQPQGTEFCQWPWELGRAAGSNTG